MKSRAQQLLETVGEIFPYYWQMPDVAREVTPPPSPGPIPPEELTLKGSRGFVNMSAIRGDGSPTTPHDINPRRNCPH
jgi:hypothetical protein